MSWDSGYQLRVKEPGARERIFPLEQKLVRVERAIGQIPSLEILLLQDQAVSRHHATFKWQTLDQTFLLVHESKTNPTLVNGESFRSIMLAPGDIVQMGDTKIRLEELKSETKIVAQTPVKTVLNKGAEKAETSHALLKKALEAPPAKLESTQEKSTGKFTWKPPDER